jgi:hypothetical protein
MLSVPDALVAVCTGAVISIRSEAASVRTGVVMAIFAALWLAPVM